MAQAANSGLVEPAGYDQVSPAYRGLYSRWAAFGLLAKTPGIKGVVILDAQPRGYEDEHSNAFNTGPGKLIGEISDLGYAIDQRLAFIRSHSIDPIDLIPERFPTAVDLRQPFFRDNGLRGDWSIYDGSDDPSPALEPATKAWDAYRSQANRKALDGLFAVLPRDLPAPTLVEPRRRSANLEPFARIAVPWTAETPFPTDPNFRFGSEGSTMILPLSDIVDQLAVDRAELTLSRFFSAKQGTRPADCVVDLRLIHQDRLPAFFDHFFTRVIPITVKDKD
jgi:hypothetical protein